MGSTLKTWPLQKTADWTFRAIASGYELEIRSLSRRPRRFGGRTVAERRRHETRIPKAERQRSKSEFGSRNLASFGAQGVACADEYAQSPPRAKRRRSWY